MDGDGARMTQQNYSAYITCTKLRDVRTGKAHDNCTALSTMVEAGHTERVQAHRSVGRTREKTDMPGTRMVQGEQRRTEILAMRGEKIRLTAHEK